MEGTQEEDSGEYLCAISTRLETRRQMKAGKVEVLPASFLVLGDGVSTEVVLGESVALQCGARPSPSLTLQNVDWYRDGMILPVAR